MPLPRKDRRNQSVPEGLLDPLVGDIDFPAPLVTNFFLRASNPTTLINFDLFGTNNTWAGDQTFSGTAVFNGNINSSGDNVWTNAGSQAFGGNVSITATSFECAAATTTFSGGVNFTSTFPVTVDFGVDSQLTSLGDVLLKRGAEVTGAALEVYSNPASPPTWIADTTPDSGSVSVQQYLQCIGKGFFANEVGAGEPEATGFRVGQMGNILGWADEQDMMQASNLRTTASGRRRGLTGIVDSGDPNPGGSNGNANYALNGFCYTPVGATTDWTVGANPGGLVGARNSSRHRSDGTVAGASGMSGTVQIEGTNEDGVITTASSFIGEGNDGGAGDGNIGLSNGLWINNGRGKISTQIGVNIENQIAASGGNIGMRIRGGDTTCLQLGFNDDNHGQTRGITFGKTGSQQARLFRGTENNELETPNHFEVGENFRHGYLGTVTNNTFSIFGRGGATRPAALTAPLTAMTMGTAGADFAFAEPTDSAAGSTWGFSNQAEARTVLTILLNLQTRVDELDAGLDTATGIGLFA